METTDVTTEILRSIRDEIRATRSDLSERIDTTNLRLAEMRSELSRRIVDSEIRSAIMMTDLAGTMREMTGVLRAQSDLRPRVEKCESDIDDLRRRASSG